MAHMAWAGRICVVGTTLSADPSGSRIQNAEATMSAPIRGGKSRPVKEAFFVRVATPEKPAGLFFNASAFVGKQMPYNKPLATCAMRVEDDVVAFSLLHLTK